MEISYKQDMAHSFLVIGPEGEVDMKAYPLRMVLGNAIPGLLSCKPQKADGKVLFYYDVTARQRFLDAYEKFGYNELKALCQGFLKIFEQMNQHFAFTGFIQLHMETIIQLNKLFIMSFFQMKFAQQNCLFHFFYLFLLLF